MVRERQTAEEQLRAGRKTEVEELRELVRVVYPDMAFGDAARSDARCCVVM